MRRFKYQTIVLDVDSTLCRIEGIEWLARLRGAEVFEAVNDVTERAMRGEIEFDRVYASRLDAVRPRRDEVARLGDAYVANISPGAEACIIDLREAGLNLVIVSGGLREPVLHLAKHLRIREQDVHAVPIFFDDAGEYSGYDTEYPTSRQMGKATVIAGLNLKKPTLLIGDGMTDAEVKPGVDAFGAFTGVIRRSAIVALADFEISSFDQLFDRITE